MDEYGNPIPGPSKEFDNGEIIDSTVACDFTWLANEFNSDITSEEVKVSTNEVQMLNNYHNFETTGIESSPSNNIEEFFEEIKCLDFDKNQTIENNSYIKAELLERCINFIDIVSRNVVYLENMIFDIKQNIDISKRNAKKAFDSIMYEKNSMCNTQMLKLKKKAYLANFFKIGLSNCPQNPHLKELYDTGRLVLAYNGRFILEECVEKNLWNQEFKNKLETAIHIEVLNKLKTPMLEQLARLGIEREIQNDPLIKHKIKLEISDIEKKLEIISKTPFKHLVMEYMDSDTQYDWLHIAKTTNKPYLQCQRFWNILLKPHVSRQKWTTEENEKLIQIATKYGEKNWKEIALELNTNRNELQCFIHYQRYKKLLNKKGKWSKQEDQNLLQIIKVNSINNVINWQKVYFAMRDEGRSVEQIYNRWMCCLKPGIKKGFLTEQEKLIIRIAHKQNFPASVVSMNLTNRTSSQIRNAYRRIKSYDENILRGGWMPEEDKMLLSAVKSFAHNKLSWSQLAKQVPGRNAEQCRHRFKLIQKIIQKNPKITVENFPRLRTENYSHRKPVLTHQLLDDELCNDKILHENFKENRKLLKLSNESIETDADRKLKKSFLNNVYITNHCNFSSKCDLLKHVLDYLGADLIVPENFVHKDDLVDEGLMSMMTYLKEYSINDLTLNTNNEEQNTIDEKIEFDYEGVNGVLRTSDIINSDLSEIKGLVDIRMRHYVGQKLEMINTKNLALQKKKKNPLPLYFLGSVPPNFETFRMLYTYMNCLTTCLKIDSLKDSDVDFDWDNEESIKLHQRLVAIFRWPALFSGTVDYNSAKINMMINTEQTINSNHSETWSYCSKKKKPYFDLKKCL